jgi:hypothetical protein
MGKEKKPKKGGMVIVIGVGAKPKKKDQMKKAEDDAPKRERRGRGGKRSTTRRFHDRVNTGRINLEEIFDKRKIDPEEFHGEFRRRTGQDFDEYMSSGEDKFDIQEMIDDIASKSAEARGGQREERNQDRQRQIFDGLMKTPEKTLRRMGIKVEDWQRAVTQRNREGGLTDDTFKQLTSKLGDRKKIAEMAEKRATISREKGQEAQAEFTEGGGYSGLPEDVFDRTPDMGDVEQERHLATRGDEDDNEHEQNQEYERMKRLLSALNVQYGPDVVDAMARRYATEGRTGAPTSQAAVDHHGFATGGQGRGGGDSVSHLPSTVFTKPKAAANTRMSSPQEEEFEGVTFDPRAKGIDGGGSRQHQEFIMRALQSDLVNPMESAFALLKGNPSMQDARGQNIDHPAAMVYGDIAHQIDDEEDSGPSRSRRRVMEQMDGTTLYPYSTNQQPSVHRNPKHDDESASRMMEHLQRKINPDEEYNRRNSKRNRQRSAARRHGDPVPPAGPGATRRQIFNQQGIDNRKAKDTRQRARERTSQMMDTRDSSAGPNHGIERMPRPEETDIANVMDDDIQRLNPKMKNFADASGKLQ